MTTQMTEAERHALIDQLGSLEDALDKAINEGLDPSFTESLHEQVTALRRRLLDS
jgi:hypothetical protein